MAEYSCSLHLSKEPWCYSQARPCSILMWYCVWPIQMQEESHNYKAFTIFCDPSFQYLKGKERETHTQWGQETWPESKAGWKHRGVPPGNTNHRGTVLVRGWSEHGRQEHQECLNVFFQALKTSHPASHKSALSYTLQTESSFSMSSSMSLTPQSPH